jgi:hypothetical protein
MRPPLAASADGLGTAEAGVAGLDIISPVYMHYVEWKTALTARATDPIFL